MSALKRPRSDEDEKELDEPPKKRKRVTAHVRARLQTGKEERAVMEKFLKQADDERDLTEVLLSDNLAEIGRAFVYDNHDANAITDIVGPYRFSALSAVIDAEPIYYPVARLLAMCNMRLRTIIRTSLPELVPITRNGRNAAIRMAWYAWFAGARLLTANMFRQVKRHEDNPAFSSMRLAKTGRSNTLLGTQMRPVDGVSESDVVALLLGAAIHFRHETNILFFWDETRQGARTLADMDSAICGYYSMRLDEEVSSSEARPRPIMCWQNRRLAWHAIRLAHSATELDVDYVNELVTNAARRAANDLDDGDDLYELLGASCYNGRLNVMKFIWAGFVAHITAEKIGSMRAQVAEVWQIFFQSPIGSRSRAAHDWLHARLPIPNCDDLEHFTATSDAWLREHGVHWSCFEPYRHLAAFRHALAVGDVAGLSDHGSETAIATTASIHPSYLTPSDMKRYVAIATPNMLDWADGALHCITSVETIRIVLSTMTTGSIVRAHATRAMKNGCSSDVLKLFFDRIMELAPSPATGQQILKEMILQPHFISFDTLADAVDYVRALVVV